MKPNKTFILFFIFLIAMWACTLVSKSLYARGLPIVVTVSPERKYIEHTVEAEGIVEPGNNCPVTTFSGLRVESIAVHEGDTVQEGDLLFTIDMDDLLEMINTKQETISGLQATISTAQKNREIDRQRKALEEQRARDDYNALAVRQDILVGRAAEEVVQAENAIEGSENPDNEALLDALQSAAYGEADAKWNREQVMQEANRKIEDILAPEKEDNTIGDCRRQITGIQEDIARYQDIIDAEGRIYSGRSGIVTSLYITTGSRTPDTAVMLLSDDSVPCRLRITLNTTQKKYLSSGDDITVKLEGKSHAIDATVDYLTENENSPGTYTAIISLPEDTGRPGIAGTVKRIEQGELYTCCISPSLIHKTETKSYIYLLKERDGILGKEYYAEETGIKILDENESFAAIEGPVTKDDLIILSGTKDFRNGDTVRIY